MTITTQTMTDEQRKSVAVEYLKAFDNGGVTSTGGSILDLFAEDAQVCFPKWGLANGKDEIGRWVSEVGSTLKGITHHFSEFNWIFSGTDVIVCEGLLGNVALKLIEGVSEVLYDLTNAAAARRVAWRLGLRLLAGGIERLRALTDYTQYGGSPILGFEQLFIKCHGRSSARAIGNAVKVAAKAVRDHVPREIADALAAAR